MNVDCTDAEGNTALHLALEDGNTSLVEFLIENNADTNIKNNKGISPLHLATEKNFLREIKLLLSADAKCGPPLANTILLIAVDQGDDELVKLLYLQDQHIHFTEQTKNIAARVAADRITSGIPKDINSIVRTLNSDRVSQRNGLFSSCSKNYDKYYEIFICLLDHGASTDGLELLKRQTIHGTSISLLQFFIQQKDFATIVRLLHGKYHITSEQDYFSIIAIAFDMKFPRLPSTYLEIVVPRLPHKNVKSETDGTTLLMLVIKYALSHQNSEAWSSCEYWIKYLVNNQANIHTEKDNAGKTALDYANEGLESIPKNNHSALHYAFIQKLAEFLIATINKSDKSDLLAIETWIPVSALDKGKNTTAKQMSTFTSANTSRNQIPATSSSSISKILRTTTFLVSSGANENNLPQGDTGIITPPPSYSLQSNARSEASLSTDFHHRANKGSAHNSSVDRKSDGEYKDPNTKPKRPTNDANSLWYKAKELVSQIDREQREIDSNTDKEFDKLLDDANYKDRKGKPSSNGPSVIDALTDGIKGLLPENILRNKNAP